MKSKSISQFVLWISFINLIFWGACFYPKYMAHDMEATIGYDVAGYYMYLPAFFIYQDLEELKFGELLREQYRFASELPVSYQNRHVIKYPIGQALQYAPWFGVAHIFAQSSSYEADGYSLPYQFMMSFGSWIIAFIGLFFLRKILLEYFSDWVTAATIFLIVFGTNYLEYTAIQGCMAHNWLFTLYAVLIWITIKYYERPSLWKALLIGGIVGWATITRPTEILSILIPLLWGIQSRTDFIHRIQFLKTNWKQVLFAFFAGGFFLMIQLSYWKYTSGHWIFYSYDDQGFSWLSPHVIDVLFSFKSGWLTYSPVLICALFGIYFYWKKHPKLAPALSLFAFLFTYVVCAWDIWTYGGSIGIRAMVQSYPVFALFLAAFLEYLIAHKNTKLKLGFGIFFMLCIAFNFWLTRQAHQKGGLLRVGEMTKAYFLATVGRNSAFVDRDIQKLLDNRHSYRESPKNPLILFPKSAIDSSMQTTLTGENLYAPTILLDIPSDKKWIRYKAKMHCHEKEWNVWRMAQMQIKFFGTENKEITTRFIRLHRIINHNEVRDVWIDCKIPKGTDHVEAFIFNVEGGKTSTFSEFRVSVFD